MGCLLVYYAKLVAARADVGHGARVRQPERLTLLKSPEELAGFQPGRPGERGRLHFAVQPRERFRHQASLCRKRHVVEMAGDVGRRRPNRSPW